MALISKFLKIIGLGSDNVPRPYFHGPLCMGHTTLVAPPRWRCDRCKWLSPVLGREWNEGRNGMKIETKYDVGHTFWVARVYKRYEKHDIIIDGKLYTNNVVYLEPNAKRKYISGVSTHTRRVKDKPSCHISYTVVNYDNRNDPMIMESYMKKDNYERMFPDEESAMDYARNYKDTHSEELYFVESNEKWEI